MLCEICGKNQAIIFYEEKVNDQVRKLHLCQDCAAKEGVSNIFHNPFFNITGFLSGLVGEQQPEVVSDKKLVCKNCGLTLQQFVKTGFLGCCQCYNYLEEELKPLLRRIHGSIHHIGKIFPLVCQKDSCQLEIAELEAKLKQAVDKEEFELAAEVRDRLRNLKQQLTTEEPKEKDDSV